MKNLHYLFFLLVYSLTAQEFVNGISMEVIIIDRFTKRPIEFVNVGFVDKDIGTVTNAKGTFRLNYLDFSVSDNDIFLISHMGYYPIRLNYSKLKEVLSRTAVLRLTPKELVTKTVVISSVDRQRKALGNFKNLGKMEAQWKNNVSPGSEVATIIENGQGKVKIEDISFFINANLSDSIYVRTKLYSVEKGRPSENLLRENITRTIKTKRGMHRINLSDKNIMVGDDFVVSLELLQAFGGQVYFSIAESDIGTPAFTRPTSQGRWQEANGKSLSIDVGISYEKHQNGIYDESVDLLPEQIDLYWDTSASIGGFNQDDKISFLKEYLSKFEQLDVVLHSFGSQTKGQGLFKIKNGNSEELIMAIQALNYDGSSRLTLEKSDKMVLILTDGEFQNFTAHPKTKGYVIIENNKNTLLNKHYGNLLPIQIEEITPKNVGDLKLIGDNYAFSSVGPEKYSSTNTLGEEAIQGTVKLRGSGALQNAGIGLNNLFHGVYTDSDGRFQIRAGIGDTLNISHISTKDKTVVIKNDAFKNIELLSRYEMLDSVELAPIKGKEVIYKDRWGRKRSKNSIGAPIYTLNKEDFPKSAIYFRELIRGRFPSIEVNNKINDEIYSVRSRSINPNLRPAINFILDGIAIGSTPPDDLNVETISKIEFLHSLSETAIYGSYGAGGIILIETEFSNFKTVEEASTPREIDNYTDEVLNRVDITGLRSKYYEIFKDFDTPKEAETKYEAYKAQNKHSVQYYVDVFYATKDLDSGLAFSVLSNLYELGYSDPSVLRAYAFILDQQKRHRLALEVYDRILELRPNQSQSHLDYVTALVNADQIDEAANYYEYLLKYLSLSVGSESFKKILDISYRRFLTKYRSSITNLIVDPRYLEKAYVEDVVVLIEWSDPSTEFEMEFVNPDGRYFRWGNYPMGNSGFMKDFQEGQFSRMFEFGDPAKGVWSLNIRCDKTVDGDKATFLKYTRYENYGAHNEEKIIELIPIHLLKGKFNLDKYSLQ